MRVYERYDYDDHLFYPEDVERIINYLSNYGRVLVKDSTIENLYDEFSRYKCDEAWMPVDCKTLMEFEDWLNDYEF